MERSRSPKNSPKESPEESPKDPSKKKECNKPFYSNMVFYVYLVLVIFIMLLGMFASQGFYKSDKYTNLNKSPLNPPNIVFPIVWTVLFAFIIIAGYLGDISIESKLRTRYRILFAVMLLLNLMWTVFFVNGHFTLSLLDCIALLVINIILCVWLFKANKVAFVLYLIYTIWVGFALYLNGYIWWNN